MDEPRREVEPGVLTAAWGNPAITLTCGVSQPPGIAANIQCFEVNGVGWLAEQAEGGFLFTTIGRLAYVEVGVPATYAPEANALVDVAATINAHNPVLQPCA